MEGLYKGKAPVKNGGGDRRRKKKKKEYLVTAEEETDIPFAQPH